MASTLQLTAPLTGTLRYPLTHLIDLGRLILVDYQSHLKTQETVANAADQDDEMWEATNSLGDVSEIMWLLDRKRYREDQAKAKGGNTKEVEATDDPKQTEKSLLIMGANHKAEYVIPAAAKLRKEKRGDPPAGGWKNEDALLDLLEFISKNEHSGLFRATED